MNEAEKRNQADLQGYLAEQVAAHAEEIAPPLFGFIHGDSREAIDRSVATGPAGIGTADGRRSRGRAC
jgi:hypothetical protein